MTSVAVTGNNLTAVNYVLLLRSLCTLALQDQTEDRAYHNGQRRLVIIKKQPMENSETL